MLGGRDNVECISLVQHPAGADSGVITDEALSTNQHDWCFAEVIWTVDLLVGRFSGVTV